MPPDILDRIEMVCLKPGVRIDSFDRFGEALGVIREGSRHLEAARLASLHKLPARLPIFRLRFIADFRRLKFTHNGTHVLDEVTDTRKLQCEVFFPLSLTIAQSHYTRLSGSSVRCREAMMR